MLTTARRRGCWLSPTRVEQTPAGTRRVQVRYGGLHRSGTFGTKREATRRGAAVLVELGASPAGTSATVSAILADQCGDLHERRSPTYATDIGSVAGHLAVAFTGLLPDSVTPPVVEAFYRQLAGDGWTPHRVRRYHELLHGSFRRAARLGVISINPMSSVQPPRIPDTEAFGSLLQRIRADLDASIMVIEHDMALVMAISDQMYCLEAGRLIAEGTPREVCADSAVVASYLGTDDRAIYRSGSTATPMVRPHR